MKTLTINSLFKALGQEVGLRNDRQITGGCIDSRLVQPGNLFIAMEGENTDGHRYLEQAFANGAALALIERPNDLHYPMLDVSEKLFEIPSKPFCLLVPNTLDALQQIAAWWRRQFSLPVIGITGSVGKSSTKETLATLLGYKFNVLKNQGNLNNEIGLPLTLLDLNEAHQVAVLEMGFYVPGEIDLLCTIARPQTGIITNIGTVHAERAGDLTTIALGKAELVQTLPPEPIGLAVLNHDDPYVLKMTAETSAKVVTYGLSSEADLWADDIRSYGPDGIQLTVYHQGQAHRLSSKLMGRHSAYNLLSAIAVALHLEMTWEEIQTSLETQIPVQRLHLLTSSTGATLLDDSYNASPLSTMAALELLGEFSGEKIAVLGDMLELGRYETEGHLQVLIKALTIADRIVLIGPRFHKLCTQSIAAALPKERIHLFDDSASAASFLSDSLHEGQVVLVKGSHGMNMVSIIKQLEAKS